MYYLYSPFVLQLLVKNKLVGILLISNMLPLYNQFLEKKSFCKHFNGNKDVLTLGLITHNYVFNFSLKTLFFMREKVIWLVLGNYLTI